MGEGGGTAVRPKTIQVNPKQRLCLSDISELDVLAVGENRKELVLLIQKGKGARCLRREDDKIKILFYDFVKKTKNTFYIPARNNNHYTVKVLSKEHKDYKAYNSFLEGAGI